jgi:hypothetical protein
MNNAHVIFRTLAILAVLTGYQLSSGARAQWRTDFDPPRGQEGAEANTDSTAEYRNVWSLDILISNGGFGLGTIYRREFTPDIAGFVSFSVSESKDDREVEYIDPYFYTTYVPGKLNRFLVLPLIVGIQYRLFREDIVDTFRPFVNAGVGPTMIYQMPFVDITVADLGNGQRQVTDVQQVDFFNAIGRGHPTYTASAFVGFGANFGTDRHNVLGVNFRYYFTYALGDGLPSLYDPRTGDVRSMKKDFGGFFITFNVGTAY